MGNCRPMYGFDGKETENLRARFRKIRDDCEWPSIEAFLLWAKESGYMKGNRLYKRVPELPHGPGNSFWSAIDASQAKQRYMENLKKNCKFCKDCQKECPLDGRGCKEWADYWKKNWNKNIHVPPVKLVVEEGPMVFRYEHPDLVREGIVWQGN